MECQWLGQQNRQPRFCRWYPVHISSGTAALAISLSLKKCCGYGTADLTYVPHNTTYVALGTIFLWFGWFGM